MTPIDPIAGWIEPNVQIENVVSGRGKARKSARTTVTGIGYAMTHYPVQALAVAGQGYSPQMMRMPYFTHRHHDGA